MKNDFIISVLEKFKLDRQIAVVTGSAGLYGELISTALAEAGVRVIISSRNGKKCEPVASSLRQQGLLASGHDLDVGSEPAMREFVAWVVAEYGRIDTLANNAVLKYGSGVAESFGENEFVGNYKRFTPMGRFADDEDIKGPIVFLASSAASYVTWHTLIVAGGWTSW